ncbi:SLAP domain-containing protein [Heyndrickxia sporothermodurans]|uniref:SLAP domain-containing protein n=1 Tax=Heyndrickxia sporothermodurans TaxID=46224 RepID=UPI002DBE3195|nr:SLAP domain-containing protein [Heyndrickxia sporothermodurans]MEB6551436.1 SLAP domain-containing protein [Heyndrickxia sporothermodurans]MED3656091.1 SLAP domain-containing protein [Heyndrickxia sporothermodurans]
MQNLQFERAWDKTISEKDRERINNVFLKTNSSTNRGIQFTPLWQAVNHKSELLVTTLIQNFSEQTLIFNNRKLLYFKNNKLIAEHIFSIPNLLVERNTSIPWTFIFPVNSVLQQADLLNGYIEMDEKNN